MDVRAMQKGFQQQVNAMDIPIESEDIIYYLNRGQERFVDDQYVFLRGKYTDNGQLEIYQTSQKAIENLRTLITTASFENISLSDGTNNEELDPASNYTNAMQFTLPDDFYYYVRSQTQLYAGDEAPYSASDYINNRLVEQENIQKFIKTKYNSPVFRDFLILLEGTQALVFYDDQDLDGGIYKVVLTYLKTPKELVLSVNNEDTETTTSDLPKHTHQDIIDLAVRLMLIDRGNIQPKQGE